MAKKAAWIIDTGMREVPRDMRKGIPFVRGVGVLSHDRLAGHRPDIYDNGAVSKDGFLRPNAMYAKLDLEAFATYFKEQGARVTEVPEATAAKLAKALDTGKAPDAKYLREGILWDAPKAAPKDAPAADAGGEPAGPDDFVDKPEGDAATRGDKKGSKDKE